MLDNLTGKIYLKSIWFALIFWKLKTVFPISWELVENFGTYSICILFFSKITDSLKSLIFDTS